ncbi:ABC transporter substrate-binding protein [Cyclobacterium jeungdonense]|uniref:ABC transporter substrate-binding protein n=1 Tax=Cyclobacterium jeungdonense TaxID=708087 RepID=A0ABT8CE91_9BACT|nr:ABC transporter substrate-binding protein [Cyclobacterium jeungdonense]MDN3690741.1 ABC transporter substrate-binding protein [Cyclobacterium jeungdonense]
MEKITITGVPEHFNFPWLKLVEKQPFLDEDIQLVWENESKGSGAMNRSIREGNTDLAIILTESFVKDKIEGNPGKIIGFHVDSPLVWGIHVPGNSKLEQVSELKNVPFLVSRMGSGSHLMAFLLAREQGWDTAGINFEIIGNLDGAIKSFKSANPKAFLWEKYTTQPLVTKGWFRRIGEIPTPWPCFVIVASDHFLNTHPELTDKLLDAIYAINSSLMEDKKAIAPAIQKTYDLGAEDVNQWLKQTSWATSKKIHPVHLENTMKMLSEVKLIQKTLPTSAFLAAVTP